MKEEFVIIGGGMAGLCAANRLAESGASPVLIEAGTYPAHKICGEFISPASLDILEKWNIYPKPIHQAIIRTKEKELRLPFATPAGSLSHTEFDVALAKRAVRTGATLLTQTKVVDLKFADNQTDSHLLELSNGMTLEAKHLFIAAGRLPQLASYKGTVMRYIGFKAYYKGLAIKDSLEMFSFPGGYMGIVPVAEDCFNIAGIVDIGLVQNQTIPEIIDLIKDKHPLLDEYLSQGGNLFSEWMHTPVPPFGIKKTPTHPRTYFIGDAAATIPPASGNGLTLAIQCGCLAAHHALHDDPARFKMEWQHRLKKPIFFAKLLHEAMSNPHYGNPLIAINRYLPIAKALFSLTR